MNEQTDRITKITTNKNSYYNRSILIGKKRFLRKTINSSKIKRKMKLGSYKMDKFSFIALWKDLITSTNIDNLKSQEKLRISPFEKKENYIKL